METETAPITHDRSPSEQSAIDYIRRIKAQRDDLKSALNDAIGWLNHSDVRYLISTKLGEQAALHATLNKARTAIQNTP